MYTEKLLIIRITLQTVVSKCNVYIDLNAKFWVSLSIGQNM